MENIFYCQYRDGNDFLEKKYGIGEFSSKDLPVFLWYGSSSGTTTTSYLTISDWDYFSIYYLILLGCVVRQLAYVKISAHNHGRKHSRKESRSQVLDEIRAAEGDSMNKVGSK